MKKKRELRYIVSILVDIYNITHNHNKCLLKWGKCCLVKTRMNRNTNTMTSKMNTRPM